MPLITKRLILLKNGENKVLQGVVSNTLIIFTEIIIRKGIIFLNKVSEFEMKMDFL